MQRIIYTDIGSLTTEDLLLNIHRLQNQVNEKKKQIQGLKGRILELKNGGSKESTSSLEKTSQAILLIEEAYQKKQKILNSQILKLKSQVQQLQSKGQNGSQEQGNRNASKATNDCKNCAEQLKEVKNKFEEQLLTLKIIQKQSMQELKENYKQLQRQKQTLEQQYEKLKQNVSRQKVHNNNDHDRVNFDNNRVKLESDNSQLKNKVKFLQDQLNSSRNALEEVLAQIGQNSTHDDNLKQQISVYKQEISKYKNLIQEKDKQLLKNAQDLESISKMKDNLLTVVKDKSILIQKLEKEKEQIRKQMDDAQKSKIRQILQSQHNRQIAVLKDIISKNEYEKQSLNLVIIQRHEEINKLKKHIESIEEDVKKLKQVKQNSSISNSAKYQELLEQNRELLKYKIENQNKKTQQLKKHINNKSFQKEFEELRQINEHFVSVFIDLNEQILNSQISKNMNKLQRQKETYIEIIDQFVWNFQQYNNKMKQTLQMKEQRIKQLLTTINLLNQKKKQLQQLSQAKIRSINEELQANESQAMKKIHLQKSELNENKQKQASLKIGPNNLQISQQKQKQINRLKKLIEEINEQGIKILLFLCNAKLKNDLEYSDVSSSFCFDQPNFSFKDSLSRTCSESQQFEVEPEKDIIVGKGKSEIRQSKKFNRQLPFIDRQKILPVQQNAFESQHICMHDWIVNQQLHHLDDSKQFKKNNQRIRSKSPEIVEYMGNNQFPNQ